VNRFHVLFVDDEPSIRLTLPQILQQQGFDVTAVATVSEAIQAINAGTFEVLIADLNVGEPGDGFTVVSAMRRTQPDCVNLILTGYPAFETALEAIRNQVDDYIVKPAEIPKLVEKIKEKVGAPKKRVYIEPKRLAAFLRDHTSAIVERSLMAMKRHARLGTLPLSDKERVDHIPGVMEELVRQLESSQPGDPTPAALEAAAKHGRDRKRQGYTFSMLVDDTRVLDSAIYNAVQENLLGIELSTLVPDLSRVNDGLEAALGEALKAYFGRRKAA